MQARYRTDYAGEFVVLETRWSAGKKQQVREFVPNPIENHHISGRAACIGTQADHSFFDYRRLQRHRGGLLGSKKLQTYGTGNIAQTMRLDFAVETNPEGLKILHDTDYHTSNIVYTSAKNCIANPGEFYLIPFNPKLLDATACVYLAAFDSHKEIFLLGYNRDVDFDKPNWPQEIVSIMQAYSGTKFYFVGQATNMYDDWLACANAECLSYREFISYCDV